MATTKVVNVRLDPVEVEKLKQLARRAVRTPSEIGADLLSESIRCADFAFIEFRDSASGRLPYIQGTRLAVWQAITVLRSYGGNIAKAAAHLKWPEAKVHAAVAYAKAFPSEIEESSGRTNQSILSSFRGFCPASSILKPYLVLRRPNSHAPCFDGRGVDHGGVIFVDNKSFAQNDFNGIAKALVELWNVHGQLDWKNRCFFLTPRR